MDYPTAMMMVATSLFQEVESPAGQNGVISENYRSGAMANKERNVRQHREQKDMAMGMQRSITEVLKRLQKEAEEKFESQEDLEDFYMSLRSQVGGV